MKIPKKLKDKSKENVVVSVIRQTCSFALGSVKIRSFVFNVYASRGIKTFGTV